MGGIHEWYTRYCWYKATRPNRSRRRGPILDNLSDHLRRLCSLYWAYRSKAILFCTVKWQGLDVLSSIKRLLIYHHRSTFHSAMIARLVAVRGFSSISDHQLVELYLSCRCIHSLFQATTFRRQGTSQQTRNLGLRQRCQWMEQSTSRARPELWWQCS